MGLEVKCPLGCSWTGELRHSERHTSPSDEGDCPLVEVPCKHGCGQIMKRRDQKEHEEEACLKRPIEVQLSRLQFQVTEALKQMKEQYKKEIITLKETISKQKEELAALKSLVEDSRPKVEGVCLTHASLNSDVLRIMPKLSAGNIPGVVYHAREGRVEVNGCCDDEVNARSCQFRVEYQKTLLAVRSKMVILPVSYHEQKLQDLLLELNIKYSSSYLFLDEKGGKKAIKILSILPSRVEELFHLLESRMSSLKIKCIQLSEKRTITLRLGDIAKEDTDVIVSTANRKLNLDTHGVSRALNRASNGELAELTEKHIKDHGHLETGDVAVTKGGGNLKCKYVFHLAGPTSSFTFSDASASSILQKGISRVLTEAERHNVSSIAIPAVGAGSYLLKNELIASSILRTVKEYQFTSEASVTDIRIVVYSNTVYPAFVKAFNTDS